jgi:uncharacterized membrane protein
MDPTGMAKGMTAKTSTITWAVLALILLAAGVWPHTLAWGVDSAGEDIYYAWVEGQRLLAGENPYARVLAGDMLENDKYATYFPLFYLLSALSQALGLRQYGAWIAFWQPVFLLFHLATGVWLLALFSRRRQYLLSLIVLAIWLFGNWVLHFNYLINFDAIPIFFLVVSLTTLDRRPLLALLLFSLSLALKQVAIFLAPLYLIWLWQEGEQDRPVRLARHALVIASVPLLTSLPFVFWNAKGFVRSVLFSATRASSLALTAGRVLDRGGLLPRLPLLSFAGAVYLLAWRRRTGRYTAAMLGMLGFLSLNPVVFPQYLPWFLVLLLLALLEIGDGGGAAQNAPTVRNG